MSNLSLLEKYNRGLHDIREVFHKTGRLDDSNTKLDEISKLLCLEVASAYCPSNDIPSLADVIGRHRPSAGLVDEINAALAKAAQLDIFKNYGGDSLLGPDPRLNLAASDGEFARKLGELVVETFNGHLRSPDGVKTFELMNEAFGHFVRDNFRNNIEDAQYMTPPEVVDFMCELGLDEAARIAGETGRSELVVCDPSCGVGSFLAQFYRAWIHSQLCGTGRVRLLGQDKVDRMARLAKLNLLLFGVRDAVIARGNTLLPGSELDGHFEGCDLILTNPPFGARFHTSELVPHCEGFFPCLSSFVQASDCSIDSELLFLDRYLSLLRPGGAALAVVPDAVVSATGLPGLVRQYLGRKCTVVSITELPAVTFAQAGTRTKTCVLHFRKEAAESGSRVAFACVGALGFEVASRKGVPYKRHEGENELPAVLEAMRRGTEEGGAGEERILSHVPSCVSVLHSRLAGDAWTPNHHSASRYSVLAALASRSAREGARLVRLRDVVTLPNEYRRGAGVPADARCISVLHVGDLGSLNIGELMEYAPKYKGQPCRPGDILFSKINPRIPRALVVPELGFPLSCSTEFEVMRAVAPYSAYEVMLLLLSSQAQVQIRSLTSGTSSSHNRVKTEQLLDICLSIPAGGAECGSGYRSRVEEFGRAHQAMIRASVDMYEGWLAMDSLLEGGGVPAVQGRAHSPVARTAGS